MDIKTLHENLKKIQEPKGYFFNKDKDLVYELLEALLNNKNLYGYMACPCRLACGDKNADKDIMCPCEYREKDVKEYGACFCGLYVSRELNDGQRTSRYVPERRPPEKIC